MQPSPARTLSKPQFLAQRPHGNYANYLSYVASRRKQLAGKGSNAGPTKLDPTITNLLALLPHANSPAFAPTPTSVLIDQAQKAATAATQPVISQLSDVYGKRAAAGAQAIKGFTDFYGQHLADSAGAVKGVYDAQRADEAALTGALGNFQAGVGQQGASELEQALKAINAPGADQAVSDAQALGHNVAAAGVATGTNELSRLLNEGTGQEAYANMLPGIAGLEGTQRTAELEAGLNSDLADRVGQITATVPGMVQDYLTNAQGREDAKAQFRAGLQGDRAQLAASIYGGMADRDTQAKIAAAGFNVDLSKLQETQAYHQDTIDARLAAIAGANARAAQHERNQNARTGATIAAQNTRAALKGSGLSQKDVNRLLTESVKYGTSVRTGPVNPLTGLPDSKQAIPLRGKAYNRVYSWWKSRLPKAGQTKLDTLTNQTLNQAGYPPKKK